MELTDLTVRIHTDRHNALAPNYLSNLYFADAEAPAGYNHCQLTGGNAHWLPGHSNWIAGKQGGCFTPPTGSRGSHLKLDVMEFFAVIDTTARITCPNDRAGGCGCRHDHAISYMS